jgi:hypothetical protein
MDIVTTIEWCDNNGNHETDCFWKTMDNGGGKWINTQVDEAESPITHPLHPSLTCPLPSSAFLYTSLSHHA